LRRVDEVLATGYLIIRGAVETTTYVIVAIAWLTLTPLADTMSALPITHRPPLDHGVGLIGIPLYVAAYLLAMHGAVGINSSSVNVLSAPLALQEMVLAVWLIARGFRPAVLNTSEA
jgi:hypothetical protein